MKHNHTRSFSDAIIRLLLPASLFALSLLLGPISRGADLAGTGSILGTVTSASTHNALQGALVSVPAQNLTAFTDSAGGFALHGVGAGTVDVVVSYSGFDESRHKVAVAGGAVARLSVDLKSSELITMQPFTVESVKEGQALSITEQRNAGNIKNVTALDEWGNLPTLSVGELASRLPGITYVVDEDNLISNVSIRGMPSTYTRLNVDGMSSTGVGGDGRSATLHSFSGAMYEQIEIIAGQTPDKRADSLGGQLNLKTRSPLAMSESRRFNYAVNARVSPAFAERSQQRADHPSHPIVSFNYQEKFSAFGGSNNLGIALNTSYSEIVNMIVYDNLFYESTTNPAAFFNDYTTLTGQNDRFITGIHLRADYKPSARTTISLRLLYNAGSEPYYQRARIDPIGNGTIGTTGTASILPGYTENRTELRPAGAGATRMDISMLSWSFVSKSPTGTVAVEHDFGRLKLDYAARWSYTQYNLSSGRGQEGGELTMRADNIGFILDKSNLDGRVFTQTAGPSVFDAANYTTNIIYTKRSQLNDTNEVSGNLNAAYTLATEIPITLKTGLDTVNRRVNSRAVTGRRWNRNVNPTPAPGQAAGSMIPLSGFALMPLTRFEEKNTDGRRIPVFDPVSVGHELGDASKWTEDVVYASQQPYTGRRLLEEGVDAGYLQAQIKLGRFTALGGARFEDVKTDTFTYVKRRSTTVAAEPDPFKRAKLDYDVVPGNGHYTKAFPSIHFAYDVTPNLKARASWSTSYGRPLLAQIIPAISFNDTLQTVTAGNPSLKPQVAQNIDLKLEYYLKSGGIVTIGAFQKKIRDYILNTVRADKIPTGNDNGFEGNFSGYTLTAPSNAGDATVKGLEFDFRQRLTFLPGALKGLYFAANYTLIETTGRFTGVTEIAKNDVAGFIPKAANVRLTYNYKRFGASAGLNFAGEHISGAGTEPVSALTPVQNRLYRKDLTTFNAGLSYKLRSEAVISIDVNNLTQRGPVSYRYIPSRIRQVYLPDLTINIGVSGQF